MPMRSTRGNALQKFIQKQKRIHASKPPGGSKIEVGFKDERYNVASLAILHEFGDPKSKLPERPAFRRGLERVRKTFRAEMIRRMLANHGQLTNMATVRNDSFNAVLAACGTPPALFDDSDGTAQRESFRRYLTLTVMPLAKVLERELSAKLEVDVTLKFDGLYAHDLQGRAVAFQKLVAGGVPVNEALATSGLLGNE